MTRKEFRASTSAQLPPAGVTTPVKALWYDAKGGWASAHRIVQTDRSREGAWVHAYLHRKEGDMPNALYWYERAGQDECQTTFQEEWEAILTLLLPNR